MDVARPLEALLPAADSAVLRVLAGSSKARTGREIARLAERSQPAVQKILDRFVDQGLVHSAEAGRARTYVLNREHLAAKAIEDLANLRPELFARLRNEIAHWQVRPVHASVFGSTARGDGDAESDVDIFVVRPDGRDEDDPVWRSQIRELGDRVLAWTGNHAGIAEVGEPDLVLWRDHEPSVILEVKTDAVDLDGKSIRELLRDR